MKKKISRNDTIKTPNPIKNDTISLIKCIIAELVEKLEEVIALILGLYFCNKSNET